MKRLKIEIYLNHFVVHCYDKRLYPVISGLAKDLMSFKFEFNRKIKRTIRVPDRMYPVLHEKEGVIRFPLSLLRLTLSTLGYKYGVKLEDLGIEDHSKEETGLPATFTLNDKYTLRDYQESYVKELSKNKIDVRMVDLPTASGKTIIASHALSRIKKKVAVIILPKYIDKWIEDFGEYFVGATDRLYVAQGSEGLCKLMNNTEEAKKNYDIFIFPMRTLYNYIGAYAETDMCNYDDLPYPIPPDRLMQELGIGVILSDECHQEFFALYRALMYFKTDKIIALSATLESNDKRMQYIYDSLLPQTSRVSKILDYVPYNDAIAVRYYVRDALKIPCQRQQGYSHVMFEQYLISNTYFLKQYVDMILHYVKEGYISRKQDGEKVLIFCSTVDLCKHIRNVISKEYPKLDVRTYVQEDDYANVVESEVVVTTLQSSSTALTFPKLITTIQTIPIGSYITNVQALGRLRKIEGRATKYYYLYCGNLPKHKDLNRKREDAIKDKVRSYRYESYEHELLLK